MKGAALKTRGTVYGNGFERGARRMKAALRGV